jgi:hypothetical protein
LFALSSLIYANQTVAKHLPTEAITVIKALLQQRKARTRLFASSLYAPPPTLIGMSYAIALLTVVRVDLSI